jgi:hypothetical protein
MKVKEVLGAALARRTLHAEFGTRENMSLIADSDLSAKQYIIMAVGSGTLNSCHQASLSTDPGIVGVLQNAPKSGEPATVSIEGFSKVTAGGALGVNVFFGSNSSGKAQLVASGDMVVGRTLEAATADKDVISVLLVTPIRWSGAAT